MPVRVATLSVFANPWTYIDEHGRPVGVCMVDVNQHVAERRWVGARVGAELLEKAQVEVVRGRTHETRSARHKLHIEYATEPEEVPNTAYYRERVRTGDLFAADAKTALVSGLLAFTPVAAAEAKARETALAQWAAENGFDPDPLPGPFFSASPSAPAPEAKTEPDPKLRAGKASKPEGDS